MGKGIAVMTTAAVDEALKARALDSEHVARLLTSALEAREYSYSPYSKFKVGAALLLSDGTVIKGCNVENATFGATNCAERTAVFSAISQGRRDFVAIAVIGDSEGPVFPCGICRQVLGEFSKELLIISANLEGETSVHKLSDLLPCAFQFAVD